MLTATRRACSQTIWHAGARASQGCEGYKSKGVGKSADSEEGFMLQLLCICKRSYRCPEIRREERLLQLHDASSQHPWQMTATSP